jgi:hypothetical protein
MKTIILLLMLLWFGSCLFAQTNPAQPTPTTSTNGISSTSPTTNGNLNTTGSNPGVNPNGNPGTIINSTGVSNQGVNATPIQPTPPNTRLTSSPVTPVNTTVNADGVSTLTYSTTINGVTYPAGTPVSSIPSLAGNTNTTTVTSVTKVSTVPNPPLTINTTVDANGVTTLTYSTTINGVAYPAGTAVNSIPSWDPNTATVNAITNPPVNTAVVDPVVNTYPAGTTVYPPGTVVNSTDPMMRTTTTVNGEVISYPAGSTPPVSTSISGSATTTVPANPDAAKDPMANEASPVNNGTDNYRTMSNVNLRSGNYSESVQVGLARFAALPVLSTYVPDNVVVMLKEKYADRLYDITRIKVVAGSDQYKYIVRLQDNGVFSAESVDDQGMAMR